MNGFNTWIVFVFCFSLFSGVTIAAEKNRTNTSARAHSKCILPVPDGGDTDPSPANFHGKIVDAKYPFIKIQEKKTKKIITVKVNKRTAYYSAFGGDFPFREINSGQEVWIWLVGCKSKREIDIAAYVQIFSQDPNDINPDWDKSE